MGFPDSSVRKALACSAGDPGLIPGLRRYPGEGIGYPLQYSWASLVAQLVKNLPAMQETWVQSLGWKDPLEKGNDTTPVFWSGEFHELYRFAKSQIQLSDFHFQRKEIIKNTDPLTASTYYFCHIKLHSLRKKK